VHESTRVVEDHAGAWVARERGAADQGRFARESRLPSRVFPESR